MTDETDTNAMVPAPAQEKAIAPALGPSSPLDGETVLKRANAFIDATAQERHQAALDLFEEVAASLGVTMVVVVLAPDPEAGFRIDAVNGVDARLEVEADIVGGGEMPKTKKPVDVAAWLCVGLAQRSDPQGEPDHSAEPEPEA